MMMENSVTSISRPPRDSPKKNVIFISTTVMSSINSTVFFYAAGDYSTQVLDWMRQPILIPRSFFFLVTKPIDLVSSLHYGLTPDGLKTGTRLCPNFNAMTCTTRPRRMMCVRRRYLFC